MGIGSKPPAVLKILNRAGTWEFPEKKLGDFIPRGRKKKKKTGKEFGKEGKKIT